MAKLYNIEATIRNEIKGGYRLKVSDLDLGVYVDGFRAVKSARNDSGWWIQPPSTYKEGRYIRCPEYDQANEYWKEIEQTCIDVIKEDEHLNQLDPSSEAYSEALDNAIERLELGEDLSAVSWREPGEQL